MMGKTVSSEENAKLTKWLKTKRHEKGYTMRSLAHSFIGKIENQERRLDVIEFVRYCNALEVDPYEALSLIKAN